MRSLLLGCALVGITALAQSGPPSAQALRLEAARLYDVKAQASIPHRPGDLGPLDEAHRIAYLEELLANMGRGMEQQQVPLTAQLALELRLRQQEAEQRRVVENPAAFAKEDGASSFEVFHARAQLHFLEQSESQTEWAAAFGAAVAAGRPLTNVGTAGLTANRRTELLSRLPVRVGEMLSFGSVEALSAAVKGFDPDLAVTILLVENGGATITISTENTN